MSQPAGPDLAWGCRGKGHPCLETLFSPEPTWNGLVILPAAGPNTRCTAGRHPSGRAQSPGWVRRPSSEEFRRLISGLRAAGPAWAGAMLYWSHAEPGAGVATEGLATYVSEAQVPCSGCLHFCGLQFDSEATGPPSRAEEGTIKSQHSAEGAPINVSASFWPRVPWEDGGWLAEGQAGGGRWSLC